MEKKVEIGLAEQRKMDALELLKWIRHNATDWSLVMDKESYRMYPDDFLRILNIFLDNQMYQAAIFLVSRHEGTWQGHFDAINLAFLDMLISMGGHISFDHILEHLKENMEKYTEKELE